MGKLPFLIVATILELCTSKLVSFNNHRHFFKIQGLLKEKILTGFVNSIFSAGFVLICSLKNNLFEKRFSSDDCFRN